MQRGTVELTRKAMTGKTCRDLCKRLRFSHLIVIVVQCLRDRLFFSHFPQMKLGIVTPGRRFSHKRIHYPYVCVINLWSAKSLGGLFELYAIANSRCQACGFCQPAVTQRFAIEPSCLVVNSAFYNITGFRDQAFAM